MTLRDSVNYYYYSPREEFNKHLSPIEGLATIFRNFQPTSVSPSMITLN